MAAISFYRLRWHRYLRVPATKIELLIAGAALLASLLLLQGGWIYIKAAIGQQLLQHAWSRTLAQGGEHKPWPWADTWPVARLQVPALDIDQIVLAGDHGQALAFGPGHTPRSAALGTQGTTLISGHRDTHFEFLQWLKTGNLIEVQNQEGQWRRYSVVATEVVDANFTQLVSAADDWLVLATCWPFDAIDPGGSLRYLVMAEPVDLMQDAKLSH